MCGVRVWQKVQLFAKIAIGIAPRTQFIRVMSVVAVGPCGMMDFNARQERMDLMTKDSVNDIAIGIAYKFDNGVIELTEGGDCISFTHTKRLSDEALQILRKHGFFWDTGHAVLLVNRTVNGLKNGYTARFDAMALAGIAKLTDIGVFQNLAPLLYKFNEDYEIEFMLPGVSDDATKER